VDGGGNIFEELLKTVEVCSLGQITERLQQRAGRFRPLV
jgi:methylmalonyl-CoA mutase